LGFLVCENIFASTLDKNGSSPAPSTFAGVFRGLAHILILTEKYHQKPGGGGAKNLFILEAAKQEK